MAVERRSRPALLATLGGVSLLVFLLISLPARLLSVVTAGFGLQLINPSGSIWQGQASAVRGPGISLQAVSWDLHRAALLWGRLGAAVEAKIPGGFVQGYLAAGLGGNIQLEDAEIVGPLSIVGNSFGVPLSGGEISVRMSFLELQDNWPVAAVGEVRLGNVPLGLPGAMQTAGVGSFLASFDQAEPGDELVGTLSDLGGALEFAGRLVLSQPRNYTIEGLIRARPDAPDELRQALVLLGPEEGAGRRRFSVAGSL
ncbi:MAG: type II secretion system protein N [Gammaproteobacteria bacterium]|nr:type II secretion system protein N [Gammaproteobacteria bacterium]